MNFQEREQTTLRRYQSSALVTFFLSSGRICKSFQSLESWSLDSVHLIGHISMKYSNYPIHVWFFSSEVMKFTILADVWLSSTGFEVLQGIYQNWTIKIRYFLKLFLTTEFIIFLNSWDHLINFCSLFCASLTISLKFETSLEFYCYRIKFETFSWLSWFSWPGDTLFYIWTGNNLDVYSLSERDNSNFSNK